MKVFARFVRRQTPNRASLSKGICRRNVLSLGRHVTRRLGGLSFVGSPRTASGRRRLATVSVSYSTTVVFTRHRTRLTRGVTKRRASPGHGRRLGGVTRVYQ